MIATVLHMMVGLQLARLIEIAKATLANPTKITSGKLVNKA